MLRVVQWLGMAGCPHHAFASQDMVRSMSASGFVTYDEFKSAFTVEGAQEDHEEDMDKKGDAFWDNDEMFQDLQISQRQIQEIGDLDRGAESNCIGVVWFYQNDIH